MITICTNYMYIDYDRTNERISLPALEYISEENKKERSFMHQKKSSRH